MSKFLKIAASAALIAGFALPSAYAMDANSGMITNVSGDVVIERNGEYLTASENSYIMTGDKVYATNGSTATLSKSSCVVDVTSSVFVLVGAGGNCSSILSAQSVSSGGFSLPSAGSMSAGPASTSAVAAIVGSLIGGVFLISELDDMDDEPSSP